MPRLPASNQYMSIPLIVLDMWHLLKLLATAQLEQEPCVKYTVQDAEQDLMDCSLVK